MLNSQKHNNFQQISTPLTLTSGQHILYQNGHVLKLSCMYVSLHVCAILVHIIFCTDVVHTESCIDLALTHGQWPTTFPCHVWLAVSAVA